jgi:hypothetical protein
MKHPLDAIPIARRQGIFWFLIACTLLVMLVFSLTGGPLATNSAPNGIVSLELAGTSSMTQEILDSWDQQAQLLAAFGLGFDYLFMVLYVLTLGLACIWARDSLRESRWPFAGLGTPLAWAVLAAAVLDGIENVSLMWQLLHGPADALARAAQVCAGIKFLFVFLALVFSFYALALLFVGRLVRQTNK